LPGRSGAWMSWIVRRWILSSYVNGRTERGSIEA
jgi:hypothetical protein